MFMRTSVLFCTCKYLHNFNMCYSISDALANAWETDGHVHVEGERRGENEALEIQ